MTCIDTEIPAGMPGLLSDIATIMRWQKIEISKEELLSIAAKIREKFIAD